MSARETLNRWVEAMQILCGNDDNPGRERREGYSKQRQKMLAAAYAEVAAEVRREDANSFARYPWHSDGAPYDKGRDAAIEWVVSTLRRRAEAGEPDAAGETATAVAAMAASDLHAVIHGAIRSFQVDRHQPGGYAEQLTNHLTNAVAPLVPTTNDTTTGDPA